MRSRDVIGLAVEAVRRQRMRSALTIAAVTIGALAVLVLTALGQAATRYVVDRFAAMGTNLIMVSPGKIETSGVMGANLGAHRDLTLEDAEAIRQRVPGVRAVAPLTLATAGVEHGARRRDVYVVGTTAVYAAVRDISLNRGSFLPPGDPRAGGPVVVLGATVARELFRGENPVGRMVRIADARHRVIGVMTAKGQSLGYDFDDLVIIPAGRALRLFDQKGLHGIVVQAGDPGAVPPLLRRVRALLIERHREEDFTLVTQDAMMQSFRTILDAVAAALAGIACVSLAVAGIGIMNVMLVSVSERTAEVGLLKALGAQPRQILSLFLVEATLLSAIGAAVAIALGMVAVEIAAARWPDIPFHHSAAWIAGVTLLTVGSGSLFGLLPARRASRQPAIEALEGRR